MWISFYAIVKTYHGVETNRDIFWETFPLWWMEMLIRIAVDIVFCYVVLYVLLPELFLKEKAFSFLLIWIFLAFVAASINHIYYLWAIPKFRQVVGLKFTEENISVFLGALLIVGSLHAEGGFLAAIKLGKLLFIKEKETDLFIKHMNRS
jgi:hypothetical protein